MSQDPVARLEACENLSKLHYKHSQNDMLRGQLLETEDLIPNLLLLLSDGYKNLTYHAVTLIGNIAETDEGKHFLQQEKKIIQRLLSILPSTDIDCSKIENYDNEVNGWSDVAWTLHNLAECHKGNQERLVVFLY